MATKDILSMLEELSALGITLTDEQKAAVENKRREAYVKNALVIFGRKVPQNEGETKKAYETRLAAWQSSMFQMADKVAAEFESREGNKGRGVKVIREFRIETPVGSLKVELTEDVEK